MTDQRPADLHDLIVGGGPFLTVELDTRGAVENAGPRAELAWKDLRRALSGAGAPEEVLARVDPLVADAHHEGDTLYVVADRDRLRVVEHVPEPPTAGRSRGWWETLPALAPLLRHRQAQVPYVAVLADRTGADVAGYVPGGADVVAEAGVDDHPVHKAAPGGWSQQRYQRRAEDSWQNNAADTVRVLTEVAGAVRARVVVLAGDVHAVRLIEADLPKDLAAIVKVVDGSRQADGGSDRLAAEVDRLVRTAVAEDTATLLRAFRQERHQLDRYADGARAVAAALREAKVEVLLVHDDPDDPRMGAFGPQGEQVGADREELKELGVEPVEEGRLVDVLIRGALATGASVRVVPHTSSSGPSDDIGAILRWR